MPANLSIDPDLSRTVVIGPSGCGKSVFAKELAAITQARYIEMDALHHMPNWQERPYEEMCEKLTQAISADRWIIDGNYRRYRHLTWAKATAVIWLNHPYHLVVRRGFSRTLKRTFSGEDLWNTGNKETIRQTFFSRHSMLHWIAVTYHGRQRQCRQLLEASQNSHLDKIILRGQAEVNALLSRLKAQNFG